MSVAARPLPALDDSFARALPELVVPFAGAPAPAPRLLTLNEPLARDLGLDPDALRSDEAAAILTGAVAPEGVQPVAMAYSGHQFGGWSPRLGDGRALLLGELLDPQGRRVDLHLKGSGRTPFARGGDGRAAVGPMLREHVVSEAMHALHIPTTRALAVVATGEDVRRETLLPGAVLTRVAASHLRVGTFQYAAVHHGPEVTRRLLDHAIARHHPDAAGAEVPALALFEAVVDAQARLVARWMGVGFVHGVMNTDNITISGETIDFGPCAFMEAYDPQTVFSSIDHGGRYAFGNQPALMQWDLARLAEALLPLVPGEQAEQVAALTAVLETFVDRFTRAWTREVAGKLALPEVDGALIDELLQAMHEGGLDWTSTFRTLAATLRGEALPPVALAEWVPRWRERLADPAAAADAMDAVNPYIVPRNQVLEDALAQATAGDLAPVERLLRELADPFTARAGVEDLAAPGTTGDQFVTFCGT